MKKPFLFNRLISNMKKTLLFLSLFLLGFTNATQAQLRTDAEMMAAAKSALSNYPKAKRLIKEKGTNLEKLMTKSQVTIFGNEETGFAVIANDKRNPAIMGYSDNKIDVNNLAPGFVWWLEGANESLERMIATGQRPKAPVIKAAYRDHVDELLITKWGQQKPYNLMTPEYNVIGTTYAHYVTGCVATAMAQIMYYHKYPTRGKGQISYTMVPEAGTAIQINGNFNTKFDWDNMLPVYKEGSYTEAQANAVATLMKLCGASVKMQYTITGSGAFTSDACRSMRKYFLYDEHMRYYFRDYFPIEEWMDIIFNEINNGYPMLYGGASSSGHEFILDGYNDKGLVHVNWGWNGDQNGYFDIASLNGYSKQQEMVAVHPPHDDSKYVSLWGMNNGFNVTQIGSNFNVTNTVAYNFDVNEFNGELGLIAKNLETGEESILYTMQASKVEMYKGLQISNTGNISTTMWTPGQYRIYWASKGNTEVEWQPIRCHETSYNSYILTKTGTGIKVEKDPNANWTVSAINGVEYNDNKVIRVYDTTGKMVYASPYNTFQVDDIPTKGILILKNGSIVKKIIK